MNMQNMTPWRMFWGMIGIVLILRVTGIVNDGLWILLGLGLLALLGSMIVKASPEPWQSRLGGMVAIALTIWFSFQVSSYIWNILSEQRRAAIVQRYIQADTTISQMVRANGAMAEQARAAFCAKEEQYFTNNDILQHIDALERTRGSSEPIDVRRVRIQNLQKNIADLKVRITECQGGTVRQGFASIIESYFSLDMQTGEGWLYYVIFCGLLLGLWALMASVLPANLAKVIGMMLGAIALIVLLTALFRTFSPAASYMTLNMNVAAGWVTLALVTGMILMLWTIGLLLLPTAVHGMVKAVALIGIGAVVIILLVALHRSFAPGSSMPSIDPFRSVLIAAAYQNMLLWLVAAFIAGALVSAGGRMLSVFGGVLLAVFSLIIILGVVGRLMGYGSQYSSFSGDIRNAQMLMDSTLANTFNRRVTIEVVTDVTLNTWYNIDQNPNFLKQRMGGARKAVLRWLPCKSLQTPQRRWITESPGFLRRGCRVVPTEHVGENPPYYYQDGKKFDTSIYPVSTINANIPFRLEARNGSGVKRAVSVNIECPIA